MKHECKEIVLFQRVEAIINNYRLSFSLMYSEKEKNTEKLRGGELSPCHQKYQIFGFTLL